MAEAEVGDDVFGDDPTVIALEERAAELTGKEAALFVASGTMGNLVAQHGPRAARRRDHRGGRSRTSSWTRRAGHAVISGAIAAPRARPRRTAPWTRRGRGRHPTTRTIPTRPSRRWWCSRTPTRCAGAQPLSAAYTDADGRHRARHGVPLHVDGARLFNAVVALGTPVRELLAEWTAPRSACPRAWPARSARSSWAPTDFIWRARRARKMVGGGMRQVGVLAAAGLIALRDGPTGMIERLAEDHANARRLADGLAELPGITGLDPARVGHQLRAVHGDRPRHGQTTPGSA